MNYDAEFRRDDATGERLSRSALTKAPNSARANSTLPYAWIGRGWSRAKSRTPSEIVNSLLTGWSLVRIRPGEPSFSITYLTAASPNSHHRYGIGTAHSRPTIS